MKKDWQTTLAGILTIIASVAGALANYLKNGTLPDPALLASLWAIGVGLIRAADSKPTPPPDIKRVGLIPLIVAACVFSFAGCETLARWHANPAVQKAERIAGNILVSALSSYGSNGGRLDNSFALGIGVHAVTEIVKATVSNQDAAKVIVKSANEFSSDPTLKGVAYQVAQSYVDANPTTPESRAATVTALANGIINAATKLHLK
jgi:hypothetical protein